MKLHMIRDLKKSGTDSLPRTTTFISDLTTIDAQRLGELFLDAYKDTVDYEGESLEDAIGEVNNVLTGAYGELSRSLSGVIVDHDSLCSALFAVAKDVNCVFIPYVVTAKSSSRRGYARELISNCLISAEASGYSRVELYVTEGNVGAVKLYESLGFVVQ